MGAGPDEAEGSGRARGLVVRLVSYQTTIAAPIEVVWEHLTTAAGLVRWIGPDATAEPVPGGILRWTHPNGATVVGRFVELIPHRRVVFTYGWEDARMSVPPESTTVEIDLVEEGGKTTLRLLHRGLPPEAVDDHERGWIYFLGALQDTLSAQ
jgi:uncharacterized protein YndB with AHSA1/START domain